MTAFLLAAAAAGATMLGWVFIVARRRWSPRAVGVLLLVSATVMIAVSVLELLPVALQTVRPPLLIALVSVGVAVVLGVRWTQTLVSPRADRAQGAAVTAAFAIGLHNIPEGAAVVTAAMISPRAGIVTAIAVGLHNIPEGIVVSSVVMAAGGSRLRAFVLTAVATTGEILGAAVTAAFGQALTPGAAAALMAVVAGIMIGLSLLELLPAGMRMVRGAPLVGESPPAVVEQSTDRAGPSTWSRSDAPG